MCIRDRLNRLTCWRYNFNKDTHFEDNLLVYNIVSKHILEKNLQISEFMRSSASENVVKKKSEKKTKIHTLLSWNLWDTKNVNRTFVLAYCISFNLVYKYPWSKTNRFQDIHEKPKKGFSRRQLEVTSHSSGVFI